MWTEEITSLGCFSSNLSESQATQTIYFFSVLRSAGMLAFPPPHLHGLPIIQHWDKLNYTRTPSQATLSLLTLDLWRAMGGAPWPSPLHMKGLSVLLLQQWVFPPAHKSSDQTPPQSLIHCRKAQQLCPYSTRRVKSCISSSEALISEESHYLLEKKCSQSLTGSAAWFPHVYTKWLVELHYIQSISIDQRQGDLCS